MVRKRIHNFAVGVSIALLAIVILLWMESYQKNWLAELGWLWRGSTERVTLNAEPGRMTLSFRREGATERLHRFRFDTYDVDDGRVSPSDWAYNSRDTIRRAQFGEFRYYVMVPNYGGPAVSVRVVDIPAWFFAALAGLLVLVTYALRHRLKIRAAEQDP